MCTDCQDYLTLNSAKTACEAVTCASNQVVSVLGVCTNCTNFKIPDASKRSCIDYSCGAREKKDGSGGCTVCPEYQSPNIDATACEVRTDCGWRVPITKEGECGVTESRDITMP